MRAGLAVTNLVLAAGIVASGAPHVLADFRRLPAEATVSAVDLSLPVDQAEIDAALPVLESAARTSVHAHGKRAFVLLAASTGENADERAAEAALEFRTYLAGVPGDARAWAGLAQAEIIAGDQTAGREALKMSILTSPSLLPLVLWRCALAIDLYPVLDQEARPLVEQQFRLAADNRTESLVRLVAQRRALMLARIMLTDSPDSMAKFEARWARR